MRLLNEDSNRLLMNDGERATSMLALWTQVTEEAPPLCMTLTVALERFLDLISLIEGRYAEDAEIGDDGSIVGSVETSAGRRDSRRASEATRRGSSLSVGSEGSGSTGSKKKKKSKGRS